MKPDSARLGSTALIPVKEHNVPGNMTDIHKLATSITEVQAQSAMSQQKLPPTSPPERAAVMIIPGQTNLPVNVIEKFSSWSGEYALSVIGILCIVYGIVAK